MNAQEISERYAAEQRDFSRVSLNTNLQVADLQGADLTEVNLKMTKLKRAYFDESEVQAI